MRFSICAMPFFGSKKKKEKKAQAEAAAAAGRYTAKSEESASSIRSASGTSSSSDYPKADKQLAYKGATSSEKFPGKPTQPLVSSLLNGSNAQGSVPPSLPTLEEFDNSDSHQSTWSNVFILNSPYAPICPRDSDSPVHRNKQHFRARCGMM